MGLDLENLAARCEAASFGDYAWSALLQDIAEWVGGSKAMLLGMPGNGPYRRSLDWNHDQVAMERYNSHYNRFDPRAGLSLLTPVHQSQLGQQYVRNEDIEHTEYFEAINRFGDVRDSVLRYADHGGCDSGKLGGAPLFIARDRLASMDPATFAVVEAAVGKALEGETLSFRLGGAAIEVSPLPSPLRWMGSDCVFLSIGRANNAIASRARLFAKFHHFTERETAILEVLMREADMRRAGEAIGIGYETLRWHVKNMCHKSHHARRESMVIAAVSGDFEIVGG